MPNGRLLEEDVPFKNMSGEAKKIYMENYTPTLTYEENLWVAMKALVEPGDLESLNINGPAAGGATLN